MFSSVEDLILNVSDQFLNCYLANIKGHICFYSKQDLDNQSILMCEVTYCVDSFF